MTHSQCRVYIKLLSFCILFYEINLKYIFKYCILWHCWQNSIQQNYPIVFQKRNLDLWPPPLYMSNYLGDLIPPLVSDIRKAFLMMSTKLLSHITNSNHLKIADHTLFQLLLLDQWISFLIVHFSSSWCCLGKCLSTLSPTTSQADSLSLSVGFHSL